MKERLMNEDGRRRPIPALRSLPSSLNFIIGAGRIFVPLLGGPRAEPPLIFTGAPIEGVGFFFSFKPMKTIPTNRVGHGTLPSSAARSRVHAAHAPIKCTCTQSPTLKEGTFFTALNPEDDLPPFYLFFICSFIL